MTTSRAVAAAPRTRTEDHDDVPPFLLIALPLTLASSLAFAQTAAAPPATAPPAAAPAQNAPAAQPSATQNSDDAATHGAAACTGDDPAVELAAGSTVAPEHAEPAAEFRAPIAAGRTAIQSDGQPGRARSERAGYVDAGRDGESSNT